MVTQEENQQEEREYEEDRHYHHVLPLAFRTFEFVLAVRPAKLPLHGDGCSADNAVTMAGDGYLLRLLEVLGHLRCPLCRKP